MSMIARWYKGNEPTVLYVDEFLLGALQKGQKLVPTRLPTAIGFWWAADADWQGPFPTEQAAREDGRRALRA